MATQQKPKKTPKPPQGRTPSTALISQPLASDTSNRFSLSSFSERGDLFAYVSLAVDKHKLRVYNTTTGQAIADYIIDASRISSIAWTTMETGNVDYADGSQPSKKKRRKRDSLPESETKTTGTTEVVLLGLSDGTIHFFSHSHGNVLRTLSHQTSTSPILALAATEGKSQRLIWASGADGAIRLWDVNKNEIVGSWKSDDRISYTSLALRHNSEDGQMDILAASHRIRLFSSPEGAGGVLPKNISQLAKFTGHASPIKSTKWDRSKPIPTRFISMAETDRFLYIWDIPDSSDVDSKAIASVPLDSDARSFSLTFSTELPSHSILLALSASGKISVYSVPDVISPPSSSNRSPAKLSTLLSRSNIVPATTQSSLPAHVIDASFVNGDYGSIRVARLVQGTRPVFTIVVRKNPIYYIFCADGLIELLQRYLDEGGKFIDNVPLEDIHGINPEDTQPRILTRRYMETSIAVASGTELGHDQDRDETVVRDIDGDLEVDLAELSLGQRLAAVSDVDRLSEDEEITPSQPKPSSKKSQSGLDIVPANSLTRTLIQALHSSDTRLIETCLAHSNPDLIRNTVRRLPSQLAIPLLNACVERLGRGARAANMKGGGAGASAQRGMTLVTWIRTVLAVHTGHLMTIPDLVARLSGLHATLTARLGLQESLLSLGGRLDMVLSQIEMRSSLLPIPRTLKNRKVTSAPESSVQRYVEGESDSSEDDLDVEIEVGSNEGSVEEVELGGDSGDEEMEEYDEDGEEEEEEDSDEGSDGSGANGFIDDEAEEYSEEDESE